MATLTRSPGVCAAVQCRYCQQQEQRGQMTPTVAAIQLPLTTQQLQQQKEADETLVLVRGWLEVGQWPEWAEVSALGPEARPYHFEWGYHELYDGLVYQRWRATGQGGDLLQLLVPRVLYPHVLQIVHGVVGMGHDGNAKMLHRPSAPPLFYWPVCRQDVELHVHCCNSCTAQEGPTQCSKAPL